ncbi:MAG: FAD binding domain-containing protein [Pseudomonadota bacterium]
MITVLPCQTAAEAASQLTERSRLLGGGTILMRQVNYGDQSFDRILRVLDPALRQIRSQGREISLGSAVTMSEILERSDLEFLHPVANKIGGPAIRNMATVGGNLFAEHPYGDLATAFLALDAQVTWSDGHSESLETLLKERANRQGVVASVSVPRPGSGEFRYLKVSRTKPKGVSMMCLAAWLRRDAGRLGDVRVTYGAMGPAPFRVAAVESALRGATLDAAGIAPALARAAEGFTPPEDALASSWYRTEVLPVHLSRLLLERGAY